MEHSNWFESLIALPIEPLKGFRVSTVKPIAEKKVKQKKKVSKRFRSAKTTPRGNWLAVKYANDLFTFRIEKSRGFFSDVVTIGRP